MKSSRHLPSCKAGKVKTILTHCAFACISFLFFHSTTSAQTRTLDEYINLAVHHNPILKDYSNQLQTADIDSEEVLASLKPQITSVSRFSYPPVFNGYGYFQGTTLNGIYAAQAFVNQRLLNKGYKKTHFDAINLQKQTTENTYKITEHALKAGVADEYITVFQEAQQVKFSEQVNDLLHNEMQLLKAQADAGVYKLSDLLAFSIEMHTNEIGTDQLKQQYRDDLFALNYLCGISDTTVVQLEAPSLKYDTLASAFNSPVFMKFTIDSLTLTNQSRVIDLEYHPVVNAFADAGIDAYLPQNLQKNVGFSFGMSLSFPIYDGHQRRMEHRKLEFAEQTRKNYHDFLNDQVTVQMQQLQSERKANTVLLQRLKDEETDMETLLEMNKKQLSSGSITVTDYIVNLRKYIELQSKLNMAQVKSFALINEYNNIVW